MSHHDEYRERTLARVPEGETYLTSFEVEKGLFGVAGLLPRFRVVVVTDKRVHLFTSALWRVCTPNRLLGSFPHSALVHKRARLEYSILYDEIRLAGEQLWVRLAYRNDLRDAVSLTSSDAR